MAKTIKLQTESFNRKMAINIGTSKAMQDMKGQKISNIQAAAIVEDVDKETGELKEVAVIVDGDGISYTAISGTVMDVMEDVIELINDGEEFDVLITGRKSKAGREFISLTVL